MPRVRSNDPTCVWSTPALRHRDVVDASVDRPGGERPDVVRPRVEHGLRRPATGALASDVLAVTSSATAMRRSLALTPSAADGGRRRQKPAMAAAIIRLLQPARMRICIPSSCVGKILIRTLMPRDRYTHAPSWVRVMYGDVLALSTANGALCAVDQHRRMARAFAHATMPVA